MSISGQSDEKNHYQILALSELASVEEIETAYKKLNKTPPIEKAYQVLSNSESRNEYDEKIDKEIGEKLYEERKKNLYTVLGLQVEGIDDSKAIAANVNETKNILLKTDSDNIKTDKIKSAIRAALLKHHPDRVTQRGVTTEDAKIITQHGRSTERYLKQYKVKAKAFTQLINDASLILLDPAQRGQYDQTLINPTGYTPETSPPTTTSTPFPFDSKTFGSSGADFYRSHFYDSDTSSSAWEEPPTENNSRDKAEEEHNEQYANRDAKPPEKPKKEFVDPFPADVNDLFIVVIVYDANNFSGNLSNQLEQLIDKYKTDQLYHAQAYRTYQEAVTFMAENNQYNHNHLDYLVVRFQYPVTLQKKQTYDGVVHEDLFWDKKIDVKNCRWVKRGDDSYVNPDFVRQASATELKEEFGKDHAQLEALKQMKDFFIYAKKNPAFANIAATQLPLARTSIKKIYEKDHDPEDVKAYFEPQLATLKTTEPKMIHTVACAQVINDIAYGLSFPQKKDEDEKAVNNEIEKLSKKIERYNKANTEEKLFQIKNSNVDTFDGFIGEIQKSLNEYREALGTKGMKVLRDHFPDKSFSGPLLVAHKAYLNDQAYNSITDFKKVFSKDWALEELVRILADAQDSSLNKLIKFNHFFNAPLKELFPDEKSMNINEKTKKILEGGRHLVSLFSNKEGNICIDKIEKTLQNLTKFLKTKDITDIPQYDVPKPPAKNQQPSL